jgi:chromosome segregation ATPase
MEPDTKTPPRWPYVIAAIASLVWLALAFIAMSPLLPLRLPPQIEPLAMAAGIVLNFVAPLAILWLVAGRLADSRARQQAAAALFAEHSRLAEQRITLGADALAALETRLADLTGQLTAMARPVERQHQALGLSLTGLETTASSLEAATRRAEAATARLTAETATSLTTAEQLEKLLDRSRQALSGQIAEADSLLTGLAARLAEARSEASATGTEATTHINALTAATSAAQAALAQPLAALNQGVETALTRTTEALDATRDGVHAQTSAMLASVDQARTSIDDIGGEAASAIAARLEELTTTLTDIGSRLDQQSARAAALIATLNQSMQAFDAQLEGSTSLGTASLARLTEGLGHTQSALGALEGPVAQNDAALAALTSRLAALDGHAGQFFTQLAEELPALHPRLDDLGQRLSRLQDDALALAAPLDSGAETLASAQNRMEAAAAALDSATAQLGTQLTSAEASLTSLTRTTEDQALEAAQQLIDIFGRVREVANQAAGTMRETLSGVVAEAEAALDRAGTTRAKAAFGAPIRSELEALETAQNRAAAAAQAAAERVSERLIRLTATVADVENHFDKRQTELDIRDRMDLVKRATSLLSALQAQSIDLARLLALDIEDQAYDAWLDGDRSRFIRQLALGLENGVGRSISRHLTHDRAFRAEATRYVEDFEALIAHVMQDRQGRTLAATLLASDPGKLYIALAGPEN